MHCHPELTLPKGAVREGQMFESVGPDIFPPSKLLPCQLPSTKSDCSPHVNRAGHCPGEFSH